MRHLDVEGLGRVSRSSLGTWQFGAREWGYGDEYASGAAREIVARAPALGVTQLDRIPLYQTRFATDAIRDELRRG